MERIERDLADLHRFIGGDWRYKNGRYEHIYSRGKYHGVELEPGIHSFVDESIFFRADRERVMLEMARAGY